MRFKSKHYALIYMLYDSYIVLYKVFFYMYVKVLLSQKEIEKINLWLKLNKLSLNADKTKYMIFYTNQRMIPPIALSINSKLIAHVSTFNFLGIMLDLNMLWTSHTNLVCMKLSKTIGIIKRLKYIFPNKIFIFSIQFTIYPIHTIWLIIMGI